ncbi:MAG: putative bifunctional diguanylate cyclase/phosphodiesterase [Acidimicrobiales bacterium]
MSEEPSSRRRVLRMIGLGGAERPSESAISLGLALRGRSDDIAQRVLGRWESSVEDPHERGAPQVIFGLCTRGTAGIAQYLVSGDSDRIDGEAGSDLGPLNLIDLVRMHVCWRDVTIEVLREEAERLGSEPGAVELAQAVIRSGSDVALLRLAETFEQRPAQLEAELAEERARIDHMQAHHPLTGLPNREAYARRVNEAIELFERKSINTGLIFVDIDRFASVNDMVGYLEGDALLSTIGQRMAEVLRPNDMVSQMNGAHYVIICENLYEAHNEAVGIAKRIVEALNRPFEIGDREIFLSASVGISLVRPDDSAVAATARAERAARMAKLRGGGRFEMYHPDFDEEERRKVELINSLHRALERDELVLHYQPVKDLKSGRVVAMEALLRWMHPTLGIVAPGDFIPLAEETGLIIDIGRWVMSEACEQCAEWRAEGFQWVAVSVNVSGHQLAVPGFAKDVEAALETCGLPASSLCVEITESVIVTEGSRGRAALDDLRRLGVRLAIDDFGVGFSALSYLSDLPVHSLKVDRSFVAGLGAERDASVVAAMIDLAHTLGLNVVAEGVETEAELAQLKDSRCDEAQGFLLGRPAPLATLREQGALEQA